MPDLSPEAEELVRAGRRAYRPEETDRERILQALRGRLGDAAVLGAGATLPPAAPAGANAIRSVLSHWKIIGLATLASGGLLVALLGHPTSSPPVPGVAIVPQVAGSAASDVPPATAPAATDVAAPVGEPASPQNEAKPARSAEARPAPPRHVRDGLSEEVAILARAETALHSARPDVALKALDEHERKFPNGVLAEERTAARIQALCSLGRTAEADAWLARLARMSPHSPNEERARQACREASPPSAP